MSLTVYGDLVQGSDAWLEARAGIVTASVMHQLITPSTLAPADNETARGLTATLVVERLTGRVAETFSTYDMTRGTLSEPYARQIYAEHYGDVEEIGFMRRDFPEYQIGFSPDGITDDGLLEIKSPQAKSHVHTLISDKVPTKYLAQLHTGMLVSGRSWVDFVSYHPGLPLYVRRVHQDDAWADAIHAACAAHEQRAKTMITNYHKASKGRPETPWVDVFEEEPLELKLT